MISDSKEKLVLIEKCKLAYHKDYEVAWRQIFALITKEEREMLHELKTEFGPSVYSGRQIAEIIESKREEIKTW